MKRHFLNFLAMISFKDFVFVRKTTFPIQTGEHSWEFLGTDGVIVKGTPEIYGLSANYGDDVIESDYFDFEAFASQLEISSKG